MKNTIYNIISIILICCILGAVFYEYPDKSKIDLKKQIVDFTRYEDARNIEKVLSYFQFPLLEYWQHKKVSKNELKNLYQGYWERYEYSKNEIQKIEKVGVYEFVLTTKYIYSKYVKSLNRYRLSETKFKLNKLGKITSITNLSLKKIDHQYILDNNLISDFSYTEKVLKKNNPDLAIVLTIFLLLNIIVQVFIKNSTRTKLIDEIATNVNNLNKITSKKVSNENLRDKSINVLKLREEVELRELNNRIEKEKKVLKDNALKEALIKDEKARIESEKKIEAQKEAERIRRNKIAREDRQKKVRIEKEKRIASQKSNVEAKKKRAHDLRIEKERFAKEKKIAARREARLKKREEEEESRNNTSNGALVEEDEDDFFDDNLSQYITEIPEDDNVDDESDISDFLTDKYLHKSLKNKFKNK